MGWFSTPSEQGEPTTEEVHAAGRALQRGQQGPADRLVAMSGSNGRNIAMHILAAAADYEPREEQPRRRRGFRR